VAGKLLFSYDPFVYMGVIIAIACSFYLSKTKTGLNVKAIGENPAAADAAGINVTKWKYFNIILGGAICGIGGAYCSMIINGGVWISDNVGGLGWIAVALVIFANWKPAHAIWGSFIFGALRVLKYYAPKSVFPLPNAFYDMLPFLITAIVLVVSSMNKKKNANLPASLGLNYFREER
jgi:simple sugar transport system permease protein